MYIVFDIGGTKLRLASSKDGSTLDQSLVLPTPRNYLEGIELLKTEVAKLLGNEKIEGIAGGVPAVLDDENTTIVRCANLPDWSGKPFLKDLEHNFNCPVKLENDASLGALGEATIGAGKNYNSVVYITLGTGIGGALVKNKKLDPKTRTFELGHHVIYPNGLICPSDKVAGHWEAYIKEADFENHLVVGITNTLQQWPAEIVVLGGGVTLHSNWDLEKLTSQLKDQIPNQEVVPLIKIAELGDQAGLYGALELLMSTLN